MLILINIFIIVLMNNMEVHQLLINITVHQGNNNLINDYDLILLTFMEPYIMENHKMNMIRILYFIEVLINQNLLFLYGLMCRLEDFMVLNHDTEFYDYECDLIQ